MRDVTDNYLAGLNLRSTAYLRPINQFKIQNKNVSEMLGYPAGRLRQRSSIQLTQFKVFDTN
ncbi:hypothetical protein [Anabaena sp. CCY 9402-a]|uniref:hypothetical protein n=1 Tax=Anabaena sp. CCY 9402-a TaxID=3103867 RepID=UPI0039C67BC0